MSGSSQPVSSARFASALEELPLSKIHETAAEIRNSKAHLISSNEQLQPFAAEGDSVCKEAIEENEEVLKRMDGRLDILKAEVERRGMPWTEDPLQQDEETKVNGEGDAHVNGVGNAGAQHDNRRLLSDQELQRRIMEQMNEPEDEDEDGVHL